nr:non-ribosomal peptide synthetase [Chitinophaga varians]
MKAGGAYVPIDPAYPQERIAYMIADSGAKVVIDSAMVEHFRQVSDNYHPENIPAVSGPSDLAYVIYTSGSTGKPKGVMIAHRNACAFIDWCWQEFNDVAVSTVLGVTSICFDLSVYEMFYTFSSGLTLCLLPDALSLPDYLATATADVLLNTVPGVVGTLLETGTDLSRVKVLNMAGEPVPKHFLQQLDYESMAIRNLYGPTEDTTYSTIYRIQNRYDILIGKPISNTQIYILDSRHALTGIGITGEICISGAGLARGYLHNPSLTAEKFIPHPFKAGEQMYLTGDYGHWLPDGNIAYTGRKDDQVKVRGYRIETGEIESALLNHEEITGAVVLGVSAGREGKQLVAYFTGNAALTAATLRAYLADRLPAYMVPAHVVRLEQLPLTPNGKIDRRRLPAVELVSGVAYEAPRNETESLLVAIWEDILGRDGIGIHDHFFDLGGHSLKATRLSARIQKTFGVKVPLQELFTRPQLSAQAAFIAAAGKEEMATIPVTATQADYPLSAAQHRMWILGQFTEGNVAYNIPGVQVMTGVPDMDKLTAAFRMVIMRHEILRTVFRENTAGELRQFIQEDANAFVIAQQDLRQSPAEVAAAVRSEVLRPFDLSSGPLLRLLLLQTGEAEYVLVYTMHHIISDEWSMGVLIRELLSCYEGLISGNQAALPPLRIQYRDYASWQANDMNQEGHRAYWLQQLSGELPIADLPADKVRPAVKTYKGSVERYPLPGELTASLRALSREQDCTLFMSLLAIVNILLYRYTGQEDIITGSPVSGREYGELEDQLGLYVNTLALRCRFRGTDSYRDVLQQVRQVTLDAQAHQAYPFDALVDELPLPRDTSRHPLFDVMVVMDHTTAGTLTAGGLTLLPYEGMAEEVAKFDLTFAFEDQGDDLALHLSYNSDIYHASTIQRMCAHVEQLIAAATAAPQLPVHELDYLPAAEKNRIITEFNDTAVSWSVTETAVTLFEQQVARTPGQTALVCGDVTYTYRSLNEAANRLADYLRKEHHIGAGDLVAIQQDRSDWMIISILGVLKAGGAYVPIDTAYPQERIAYMLTDSGARIVIDTAMVEHFRQHADNYRPENIPVMSAPGDLAYVIYTSGSTGKPKGVMIAHQSLSNLCNWHNHAFSVTASDHATIYAGVAFDAAVWELFPYLVAGASLYIVPEDIRLDVNELSAYYHHHHITISFLPTQMAEQFMEVDNTSLRYLLTGGDKLKSYGKTSYQLVNNYGPTENTVVSTSYMVHDASANIPIGQPICNTQLYILDSRHALTGIGITGEICISGVGLAKGYLHNPSLTAEKFIPHPFKAGEQMYLTGDYGHWLPEGNIAFSGRKDDQLKIRGYRIEAGEIESTLLDHEEITGAVVLGVSAGQDGKQLVAYFTGNAALTVAALRTYLADRLPAYMVPSHLVWLEQLPLTPNGKVDRRQLPAVELVSDVAYEAPRNETESLLVAIWEDILGREGISVHDHFFDLGGHSLKATRLSARIQKAFGVKVPLQELFTRPQLSTQAAFIAVAGKEEMTPIAVTAVQADYPLSAAQHRMWILSQFTEGNVAYNIPGVYKVEGVPDIEKLTTAFHMLIMRHEILRTVFRENTAGELRQFIQHNADAFVIAYKDLQQSPGEVAAAVRAETLRPFDLETGPLQRLLLLQTGAAEYVLVYTMHHIISDGWSMDILIRELLSCYEGLISGGSMALPSLRIQYRDYVHWLRNDVNQAAHRAYWLQQLAGELPIADLPSDKVRPAVKTYNGAMEHYPLSSALTASLRALCREQETTLFMSLLAIVNILLYRYTGQEDIITGSPVSGREHGELEDQLGLYINTLALRCRFRGTDSYQEVLQQVRQVTLDAQAHQAYPFDALIDELPLPRDTSRHPLFDVMVVMEHTTTEPLAAGGLTLRPYEGVAEEVAKFDLTFAFEDQGDDLALHLSYNSDIYHASTIQRMCAHVEQLIAAATATPQLPVHELDYLPAAEKNRIITEFNDTAADWSLTETVVTLFEQQAVRTPDQTALVCGDVTHTYRSLNEAANRLGDYLRKEHHIGAGDLVAIQQDRSDWMIISILGVLKAGGAYVPIDTAYPQERIAYMLTDSGARIVIDSAMVEHFRQHADRYRPENIPVVSAPGDLAYVIYTSGSTGKPKGVMIAHRSLSNLCNWHNHAFSVTANDHATIYAGVAFDAAVWELFPYLVAGASLYIVPEDIRLDVNELSAYYHHHHITLSFLPTQMAEQFMEVDNTSLRYLLTGGDKLKSYGRTSYQLVNNYGPTENTVVSTSYIVHDASVNIPIGQPISNTQLYILDSRHALTGIGITGEICISGAGLAKGYLHNPSLTAEKFIPHPFKAGEQMYLTGDYGLWLPDGNIAFTGRKDDQVKIRGYRIETGEVESALLACEQVQAAVVIAGTYQGNAALAAYIVPRDVFDATAIRSWLQQVLPVYMIPAYLIEMPELPLTSNGKIDRKQLPGPTDSAGVATVEYVGARNEVEEKLIQIWEEILGRERIGIKDNFFELGGHSIKVAQFVSRVNQAFSIRLSIQGIFKEPTIENISEEISFLVNQQTKLLNRENLKQIEI